MLPTELYLRPVPEPMDPSAIVAAALGGDDASVVTALSALALEATLAGGELTLPGGAKSLGKPLAKLVAAGLIEEVGPPSEGGMIIPDHRLRIALAARAIADQDDLPEDIVGNWLDRGFEGLVDALAAELARRSEINRCGDVIHWVSGLEAPAEEALFTARITGVRALYGAARCAPSPLPDVVFEAPISSLIEGWTPELPLVTWKAITLALGSLARLEAAPGPQARQILKEFTVHIASMTRDADPDADTTHWLWHLQGLLLGATMLGADAEPALLEMALTQIGTPGQQLRPMIAAQLDVEAPSQEVARILDGHRERARGLGLQGDWLKARVMAAGGDEAQAVIVSALAEARGEGDEPPDTELHLAALEAAASLQHIDGELRRALLDALSDESLAVVEGAAGALAHAGGATQSELQALAADDSGDARPTASAAVAALALGVNVERAAPAALAHLAAWLGDEGAAAEDGPALIDTLAAAGVASSAARAMAVGALDEGDLLTAAVLALEAMSHQLWLEEDDAPWARAQTAPWRRRVVDAAMQRLETAAPPLQRLLARAIGWCLRGQPEEAAVALTNLVAAADDGQLMRLLPTLGACQAPAEGVIYRLTRGMDHDAPQVLAAACEGAGYLVDGWRPDATLLEGWPQLFEALIACVNVGDVEVSEAAGRALWRLSRQRVPVEE